MAYCTKTDILNLELKPSELISLTDDTKPSLGVVDEAKVTAAIAKADAEIDESCQAKYTVPFLPVPEIVKGWSATLAAFNLYRNNAKPATLVDRYNKVMSKLKSIREGEGAIPGTTVEIQSLPASTTDGYEPVFKREQKDSSGTVLQKGTMEIW